MSIDLVKLEQFVAVARHGTISAAAQSLNMTQPALTRSVQSLERSTGLQLFERSRSGMSLTTAGAQVLRVAEDLVVRAKSAETAIRAHARAHRGHVAFGIGPVAALHVLPTLLTSLHLGPSRITLDIRQETPAVMEALLLSGEIEFYLARTPAQGVAPTVHIDPLGISIPTITVREGHPVINGPGIAAEELYGRPLIAVHGMEELARSIPDPGRRRYYAPSVLMDEVGILYSIVRSSDLIGFTAFSAPAEGLVSLRLPEEDTRFMTSDVGIFRLEGQALSPAAERVIEIMRSEMVPLLIPPDPVRR